MPNSQREGHTLKRISWLRAAVLGANDGIISTTSLIIGVAAAQASSSNIVIAGTAGLLAGAMSMAAGEYVSVYSQADFEQAELAREKIELETNVNYETEELAGIYVGRGVEYPLAKQVAQQLMAHDALGAHSRDELGITDTLRAKPFQAAISSACSFSLGASLPLLTTLLAPTNHVITTNFIMATLFLAILGAVSAKMAGAKILPGILRITLWGVVAMVLTAIIGKLLGAVV